MIYIVVAIAIVIAYWLFRDLSNSANDAKQQNSEQSVNSNQVVDEVAEVKEVEVEEAESANVEITEVKVAKVDNLKRIYGLGPESEKALRKSGIHTFRELAEVDIAQLEEIVYEVNPLISPDNWPAQAALAANGDWEAFEVMYKNMQLQEVARRQATID